MIFLAGFFFWWVYLAGLGLGIVALVHAIRLRRVAAFTIGLQFAPLMALLILFALAFVGLAVGQAIHAFFANTIAVTGLLAGPVATVWLIFAMVTSRAANASAGP
ncbi:hypothetical protein [Brevundimonas faecalis]|uniref:hypothetical protein n=1 Tax=Brevundimonas faecalis TaxID=947378 RepID=UPI00339100CF